MQNCTVSRVVATNPAVASRRPAAPGYVCPVNPIVTIVLVVACVIGTIWTTVIAVLERRVGRALLALIAFIELALLVELVIGIVAVAGDQRPVPTLTFLAYLVGVLLLPPAGVFWSIAEQSRPSTLVLTVALIGTAVMVGRMHQIWTLAGR